MYLSHMEIIARRQREPQAKLCHRTGLIIPSNAGLILPSSAVMPDHVHMMIAIPPKYAVSQVVGFIKGKSAIHLARVYGERKRNFVGQHFWARGYFVSTVGRDEAMIRDYIRNQEQEDKRLDQMNLWR